MLVLVTGATGFLGGWLTKRLLDAGLDVRILRRETSDLSEIKGLKVQHALGDVTDPESLSKACKDVDSVFHLAGLIGYSPAMRAPMEKINVGGTANVIEAIKANKVRKLVHLSSVVAIGASFKPVPMNEESAYNIQHLNLGYFETKKAAEDLVTSAFRKGEIDTVILNPSTIYGAGDAKKGSRKTQKKVAQGKFPFYTSGGVNVVAVEDVVEAVYQAWQIGRSGERYILSSENITIKQLFEMIAHEAGVKPPSIYLPNPIVHAIGWIGDRLEARGKKGPLTSENAYTSLMYHWFDSTKAQRELKFKPRPSIEAIRASVSWMKQQGMLQNKDA